MPLQAILAAMLDTHRGSFDWGAKSRTFSHPLGRKWV